MVETRTDTPRRQQIEDAASALFRERGYAATSVRDIAQRLNIQGASLYAHVASKEDVLWAIVQRSARHFADATGPIVDDASLAPAGRLRALIRAHVQVVTNDLGNATVFLHEWRFLSDERRARILAQRDAYEARFRSAIEAGLATGEFSAADPTLTARSILSALNGIATWYRPGGTLTPQQIADHHAELLLRGLGAADEGARR
jgi:AcrR family transcriptional regulator